MAPKEVHESLSYNIAKKTLKCLQKHCKSKLFDQILHPNFFTIANIKAFVLKIVVKLTIIIIIIIILLLLLLLLVPNSSVTLSSSQSSFASFKSKFLIVGGAELGGTLVHYHIYNSGWQRCAELLTTQIFTK